VNLYSDYMFIYNGVVGLTLVYLLLQSCLYLPEDGHSHIDGYFISKLHQNTNQHLLILILYSPMILFGVVPS